MKSIRLSEKEKSRGGCSASGREYTVVTRPYQGKILVSVVWIDTGEVYDNTIVDSREEIHFGIRSMLRFMDKLGGAGGEMASASRHRG